MARDAGAAAALAPVVRRLRDRDRAPLVAAYGQAAIVLDRVGIKPGVELPVEPDRNRLADWMADNEVDALLTGTSMRPYRDVLFWDAARSAGIPAVALLDHWRNYAGRFSSRREFDSLPDALAVMDTSAADAIRALGFPSERIRVTGHPQLEECRPVTTHERRSARARLGIDDTRSVVLFASEPKIEHHGADTGAQGHPGYTERVSLAAVRDALRSLSPDAVLVVRPHPLQQPWSLPDGAPETRVSGDDTPREAISAADAVTGMTSMLLLEAALSGIPTVSVRPGGSDAEFREGESLGVRTALDWPAARGQLAAALETQRQAPLPMPAPHAGATERVIELVEALRRVG